MELERERWLAEHDVRDADELDVEDAFGAHDIEYWVRKGYRLVPATKEEIAHIQECEREQTAYLRLAHLKEAQRQADRWPAWLRGYLDAIRPRRAKNVQGMLHAGAHTGEDSLSAQRDPSR